MGCGLVLCQYAQDKVQVWTEKEGVSAGPWTSLFVDRAGKLWIRGSGRILSLDPGARVFRRDEAGLAPQSLDAGTSTFVEDRSGRVITGLANGIALHNAHGWRSITTRSGFPHAIANVLFVDPHGSLWMGLSGLGLVRWLGYPDWEGWTSNDGLSSNNVWSIVRDRRGWIWAGTESNLELLKPGTNRFVQVRPAHGKMITHVLTLLATPDGRLWSGSGAGHLIAYDPVAGHSVEAVLPAAIFHIFADHAGRIWLCTGDGVWSVDTASPSQKLTPVRVSPPAMHIQIFDGAEAPSGALWFVGNSHVFRYAGRAWSVAPLPENLHVSVIVNWRQPPTELSGSR